MRAARGIARPDWLASIAVIAAALRAASTKKARGLLAPGGSAVQSRQAAA